MGNGYEKVSQKNNQKVTYSIGNGIKRKQAKSMKTL